MGKKLKFSELDQYLFGQGTHYDIYKKLGAHPTTVGKREGVYFAVWAPNAKAVYVVGEFNQWDITADPMKQGGSLCKCGGAAARERIQDRGHQPV